MIPDNYKTQFRDSLIRGEYNLLFGSGISLDSRNGLGELLRSADELRSDLCKLVGAPQNINLTRASALLSPAQREHELIKRFSNCQPGSSLGRVLTP